MEIRRKFQIDEETREAFIEEKDRPSLQPVTDEFIDSMKGVLAGRGLTDRTGWSAARTVSWDENAVFSAATRKGNGVERE